MTRPWIAILLFLPLRALAADDTRVTFLEQEVRNLQRQVFALTRRLDNLDSRPTPPGMRSPAPPTAPPRPASSAWVDAGKWRQVATGMSELEVVSLLGPPTSMRADDGVRVLLYALEIGSSGFLGGSVTLHERKVAAVQMPALQ